MTSFSESLKKKVEKLELERHLKEVIDASDKAIREAVSKAGDYAQENQERAEAYVDKAAAAVDDKTKGKYTDKVRSLGDQVKRGVSKVAEKSGSAPGEDTPPAEPKE